MRRVSLSDALDYRQITPAAPLLVQERARALYARHRLEPTRAVSCNEVRMMRALIRGGAGVGILSLLDVMAEVEQGHLDFVALSSRQARPMALTLCMARRRQSSRAAQAVMQRLVAVLKRID